MKSVFPVILIIAALSLFFFFTNDQYQAIKALKAEIDNYDIALKKSEQVLEKKLVWCFNNQIHFQNQFMIMLLMHL
jgi:nitrate/nitrite transporter NarK